MWGTLSSFIPSRLFICAKLTQILRKNNYIFRHQMFLSTRVYFRIRDEKTFLLPRGTQKEPFGWLFSSFSSLFSRKASLFFSGTRAANWNIKSAYDDAMRTTRAYITKTKSTLLSLSLCSKKASRTTRSARSLLFLISGSILWKRYDKRKKTNWIVFRLFFT